MDNLTHSLVGALLGQCGLKRRTGLAMPALVIGANLPDVDAACFFWTEGVEHLGLRRGITHGPLAMLLLPLILAGALWGWDRWQARRGTRPAGRLPVRFTWLYALGLIACLTHPALDWLNVYGVRLLEPFSSEWFYGDVLFIIDVWLWALLIVSLWLSFRREKRGGDWRKLGHVGLAAMLIYIGVNAAITRYGETRAAGKTPYHAVHIASPVSLAFWQREIIAGDGDGRWLTNGMPRGDFDLLPRDRPDIAAAVPAAAPFLVWSRAPFIEVDAEGRYMLRDARYADPRAGDRFAVELPAEVCEPEPATAAVDSMQTGDDTSPTR